VGLVGCSGHRWHLRRPAGGARGHRALFNDYKPVPAGPVRDALTGMATEAGIPADRIFIYDGSRQSNNFTANVSGVGPYARIAISDIALKGASLEEVRAVTAHEIGHYTLHHVWRSVLLLS